MSHPNWLTVRRGDAPLVVSIPHTGTDLADLDKKLVSPWLARRDADWWIDRLYDFAADLGATVVHTAISRTVIDVNRDPSGASLYPGQATTELCPTTTFDGDRLYKADQEPEEAEIAQRRSTYYDPYHAALEAEIARVRALHHRIVLYDCHSIRSVIPRLFDGRLPQLNLGTNSGNSSDEKLQDIVASIMSETGRPSVINGRFKGGWITRHYGHPESGVHALQMELACRSYMLESEGGVDPSNWPTRYDPEFAAPMRTTLIKILEAALAWARG